MFMFPPGGVGGGGLEYKKYTMPGLGETLILLLKQ